LKEEQGLQDQDEAMGTIAKLYKDTLERECRKEIKELKQAILEGKSIVIVDHKEGSGRLILGSVLKECIAK
jgi:hypothetical protein